MKKILFLILLLIIPYNIYALNYSEYSDYMYSDKEIIADDLTEVEIERRYKFYYLDKVLSDEYYLDTPENSIEISLYFTYGTELVYSNFLPEDEVSNLESISYTYYQEYSKIRYIILTNFSTNATSFSIKELPVYKGQGERININVSCSECSPSFIDIVNNKNNNDSATVPENSTIILDLLDYYYPSEIAFDLVVSGTFSKTFSVDVIANQSGQLEDDFYSTNYTGNLSSYEMKKFYISKLNSEIELDSDVKEMEGYYETLENCEVVGHDTIYSYYPKMYRYYFNEKKYLDDYYIELDNYIKDEDNYIDLYKYRVRTIIEDEIEVPEKEIIYVDKPIYIDKEVIKEVPIYIDKEVIKEIPVYITNTIKDTVEVIKELPITVEKINEVKSVEIKEVKEKNNYILKYFLYLAVVLFARKRI